MRIIISITMLVILFSALLTGCDDTEKAAIEQEAISIISNVEPPVKYSIGTGKPVKLTDPLVVVSHVSGNNYDPKTGDYIPQKYMITASIKYYDGEDPYNRIRLNLTRTAMWHYGRTGFTLDELRQYYEDGELGWIIE